uniref:FYVE-type domain-containing protein n=1 Tax=Hyaloperonospora arabidopsidis (strain Emoy2) TaxID=559515 RepID=M4BFY1_HYAAE
MVKGRFTVNPFKELVLSASDVNNLHEISSIILDSNLSRYEDFINADKGRVDQSHWKLVKSRDNTRVYQEKAPSSGRKAMPLPKLSGASSELPSLLCVGTTMGEMEDMMFGVVNPTLEIMRIKASYVEDLSGAAVLANIVEPTVEKPFNSLVVKWMEMDIPLQSTGLVRNRDYIYVEATNFVHLASGEKVGYHIMHSVDFPETHDLPGRVRANLSICGFFRQVRPNVSEIFVTGLMDPGGDMIRMLVVPTMATTFLSTLKYAHCGQMKKLQYILEKRYAEAKELGTPNRELVCVTCNAHITNRRLGDFGKSDATCKLCFGYVCHSCKIQRKLSFVTPDLLLAQRKVTFCAVCLNDAIRAPAADAARAQIVNSTGGLSAKQLYNHGSEASTVSDYASSCG